MTIETKFNIGDVIWTPYEDRKHLKEEVCDCCLGERKIYANNFGLITCPKCAGSGKYTSNTVTYIPVSAKITKITATASGENADISYITFAFNPYKPQAYMPVSEDLAFATVEECRAKCNEFNDENKEI